MHTYRKDTDTVRILTRVMPNMCVKYIDILYD